MNETKTHVTRIESISDDFPFKPGDHRCEAMASLIEEGSKMIKADAEKVVRDAGLIAAAQRVEHYEIAAYGTATVLATKLGMHRSVATLRETLDEEGKADRDLTQLAERVINFEALIARHSPQPRNTKSADNYQVSVRYSRALRLERPVGCDNRTGGQASVTTLSDLARHSRFPGEDGFHVFENERSQSHGL